MATMTTIAQQAIMQVANEAAIAWPSRAERIAKASELLLADQIQEIDGDVYRVWSRTDPGTYYMVTRKSCECKGRHYRPHLACAHMVAVRLLPLVQERAAVLAERLAREWATEDAKRLLFARWLVAHEILTEAA